jgi:hypothetical protein
VQQKYKSHTIVITSWGNLDPDGFRPEYRISRKAPIVSKSLKINQTFPTKKEAEAYALEIAKKWIDERGSDHPSTSIERGADVSRKHLKKDSVF